jgi:hypothetical protein
MGGAAVQLWEGQWCSYGRGSGTAMGGAAVQSSWQQNGLQNEYFKRKKSDAVRATNFKLFNQITGNSVNDRFF